MIKRVIAISSIISLLISITGCTVERIQTPESVGREIGIIGAQTWNRMNPNGGWPTPESAAEYCGNVVSDEAIQRNWEIDEIFKATDACGEGFVEKLQELSK